MPITGESRRRLLRFRLLAQLPGSELKYLRFQCTLPDRCAYRRSAAESVARFAFGPGTAVLMICVRRVRGRGSFFRTCGIVTPPLASKLGLVGLAGRASGRARDLRCDLPVAPYDALAVRKGGGLPS